MGGTLPSAKKVFDFSPVETKKTRMIRIFEKES